MVKRYGERYEQMEAEAKLLAIEWSLAEEDIRSLKHCLERIRKLDGAGRVLAKLSKQIKELPL